MMLFVEFNLNVGLDSRCHREALAQGCFDAAMVLSPLNG
ncbi:hypothetical protein sync_2239 [Synechococcus sp. CC9311]|nr:hypothetical protein sync_2239 [Synechococcus sp. CC9311]